jgi:hypothetical protein
VIVRLRDVPQRLQRYCSATSGYAWPAYDIDLNPGSLTATDHLAPALLSYPIKSKYLNEMFREPTRGEGAIGNSYYDLRVALEKFVESTLESQKSFEQLELGGAQNASEWRLFKQILNASSSTKGLTTVAITKILHRKRPELVPLVDRRIRGFFGRRKHEDDQLFQDIQDFVESNKSQIDDWRRPYSLPNGQPMTRLRALDIAIWMQSETL